MYLWIATAFGLAMTEKKEQAQRPCHSRVDNVDLGLYGFA